MALAFADNSSAAVDFGSATAVDNIDSGTVLFWFYLTDVANSLRQVVGKNHGAGGGNWGVFRRAADGTKKDATRRDAGEWPILPPPGRVRWTVGGDSQESPGADAGAGPSAGVQRARRIGFDRRVVRQGRLRGRHARRRVHVRVMPV